MISGISLNRPVQFSGKLKVMTKSPRTFKWSTSDAFEADPNQKKKVRQIVDQVLGQLKSGQAKVELAWVYKDRPSKRFEGTRLNFKKLLQIAEKKLSGYKISEDGYLNNGTVRIVLNPAISYGQGNEKITAIGYQRSTSRSTKGDRFNFPNDKNTISESITLEIGHRKRIQFSDILIQVDFNPGTDQLAKALNQYLASHITEIEKGIKASEQEKEKKKQDALDELKKKTLT